jgi:CBS domain-containing protein
MSVGAICCREVDLVDATETASEAARRMKARGVGTLVVIDEGERPVGLITDRDLALRVLGAGKDSATRVREIMTPSPRLVSEDTPIEAALAVMRAAKCRRLPVTDRDGKLVGIVALDDVLALLAEELELVGGLLRGEAPHGREER